MENNTSFRPLHSIGLCLSASLLLSSLILGFALSRLHATQPFVDVKGLAEREVEADLARWKINFSLAANDWSVLQENIAQQTDTIVKFLHKKGLNNDEIVKQIPTIHDRDAEERYQAVEQKNRYKARLCITVLSRNIPAVQAAVLKAGTLVKQGILIQYRASDYDPDLEFSFTKLNDIKPDMIREATLNARKAADQFAQDSGSKVGNIRHARQGQFSITATERPAIKKVRVVTNIRYTLIK